MSVDELVRSGRIVAVKPDVAAARRQLDRATRHLGTAERESFLDPDGSYEAAWPLSDGPDGVAGAPEP